MCKVTSWLVRWALVATVVALQGGCKEEPVSSPRGPAPVPAPLSPAPATPVPPGETFALSNVRFRYDEEDQRLIWSFTVSNRNVRHEGASLCFDLIDKDGYFVEQSGAIDWIGLRAGDTEHVLDESITPVPAVLWEATAVLRVYVLKEKAFCPDDLTDLRSAVLWLDKAGRPLPDDTRPEVKPSEAVPGEVGRPWLELKDARLVQNDLGEVMLSYTLTNLTKGRVSSQLCARLDPDTRCDCRGLDQAESEDIHLGLGASVRKTTLLDLKDNQNWGRGQRLQLYMSEIGCINTPEQANSNVLLVPKPRSIEAPEPPRKEDQDEGE